MILLMKKWNESRKKMNGAKATNSQPTPPTHNRDQYFPSLLPGWCNSKYSFNLLPPFESCLLYVFPWLIFFDSYIWFIYLWCKNDQLMTYGVTQYLKRHLVVYFLFKFYKESSIKVFKYIYQTDFCYFESSLGLPITYRL